jgi:hypothetical protein
MNRDPVFAMPPVEQGSYSMPISLPGAQGHGKVMK